MTLHDALEGFVSHAHPISQHRLEFSSLLPLYGTAHQLGTVRFGKDPASSVLDPWCKAHELDNLYVTDTLVLRQRGGGEPDVDDGGERHADRRSPQGAARRLSDRAAHSLNKHGGIAAAVDFVYS